MASAFDSIKLSDFDLKFTSDLAIDLGRARFSPSDPKAEARDAEQRLRRPVEKYLLKTRIEVAWDDVVGNDTARRHLIEAIEHPIKHRALFAHYGKKPTKGVLLYGPPGCGKTMFGKAAAGVLQQLHGRSSGTAALLSVKGPEIQSPYVGVTEQTIRSIFAYARAYRDLHGHPLVVFIDEADAILPSRDGAGGRRATFWEESNVATFLTEMDGLEESAALVILATNRPEAIDAAILRDGRVDRKIRIERPDRAAAEVILVRALAAVPVAPMRIERVGVHPGDGISAYFGDAPAEPMPEAAVRTYLAGVAASAVFASEQVIANLETDQGAAVLRLSDILNGAMLVGLVEQAKGNAFRRDLAAGGAPSGLRREDLELAIAAIVDHNLGLNHLGAIQELGTRAGFAFARVIPRLSTQPPRYAEDRDGTVIQIQ